MIKLVFSTRVFVFSYRFIATIDIQHHQLCGISQTGKLKESAKNDTPAEMLTQSLRKALHDIRCAT